MTELGVSWGRTSVQKLEAGRRSSVSVGEWLALALVFDVPPVWLLADPSHDAPVPVAQGVHPRPWETLLWIAGRQPLTEPGVWWRRVSLPLARVWQFAALVSQLRSYRADRELAATELSEFVHSDDQLDERERSLLRGIVQLRIELHGSGLTVPALPDDLVKRADELGVDLSGQGGEG